MLKLRCRNYFRNIYKHLYSYATMVVNLYSLEISTALERCITQSVSHSGAGSARAGFCVTGIHGNRKHEVYGLAAALAKKLRSFSFLVRA